MRFCILLRSARSEILVQSSFGLALALKALLVLCAVGYCLGSSCWEAYCGGYEYDEWRDISDRSNIVDDDCDSSTERCGTGGDKAGSIVSYHSELCYLMYKRRWWHRNGAVFPSYV